MVEKQHMTEKPREPDDRHDDHAHSHPHRHADGIVHEHEHGHSDYDHRHEDEAVVPIRRPEPSADGT